MAALLNPAMPMLTSLCAEHAGILRDRPPNLGNRRRKGGRCASRDVGAPSTIGSSIADDFQTVHQISVPSRVRSVETPLSNRESAREHWWGVGSEHPTSVLSGRQPATSLYAAALLMTSSHSEGTRPNCCKRRCQMQSQCSCTGTL